MNPISHPSDPAPGKAARFLAPALILGAICLAYLNAFPGAFQFDDFNVIVDNGRVHSLAAWAGDLRGIRPLLKLTYTLNWMAGPGPWGFHLVNLAIHGANGLLACTVLKRFAPGNPGAGWIALAATLLFALHPAQTEAVTYICGRSTSLMALFYLASLVAFIQGKEQGSRAWNLLSVLFFLLACLAKETALTLPFALLLWERAAGPWRGLKPALRTTSLHWLLFGALGLGVTLHPAQRMLLAAGFATRSIPINLLNQVQAQGYLLGTWCWPAHLNIDPFLPERAQLAWGIAGQAALLVGLLGMGIFSLRSRPWLGFGLLWFFLHLVPTNSFIPRFDLVNERQLYLPSLGLAFALATAAREGIRRFNVDARFATSCFLLLALCLGVRTAVRNRDYQSEITLWRSSLRVSPQNPRAHNNLGYAHLVQGEAAEARKAFEAALALNPDYALARANLDSLTR
ncbi:MAG: tetratricopeptide repeat protein [Holophagaceae bacterium]|nr:tetratricopeptide repeat protein [Holophagaceae bacterium]